MANDSAPIQKSTFLRFLWRSVLGPARYTLWQGMEQALAKAVIGFDRLMDWRYGIDTQLARPFTPEEITHAAHGDPTKYMPSPYLALLRLRRRLAPSDRDVFLDLGCGSGRAVMVFAHGSMRECRGFDFNAEAIDAARRNAQTGRRYRSKLRFAQGDAADYEFEDETIVFLFNPFGIDTLRAVLTRLGESLKTRPRRIKLCYRNPVYRAFLDSLPWLELIGRVPDIKNETLIYETRGPAGLVQSE